MNKILMALAFVGVVAFPAGAANVDSVVLSQQRGIDKTVLIVYALSGVEEPQDMTVSLTREGRPVEIPDGALTGERYAVSGNGEHVLSLDPSFFPDDYVVALRAEVTCSPSSSVLSEVLYKIFDLTNGAVTDVRRADIMNGGYGAYETAYSAVASGLSSTLANQFIWTGVTNYPGAKTTKLVMRKIPAGELRFRYPVVSNDVPAQANVQLTQDYWMSVFEMTRGQMRAISNTIEQPEGDAYPACNIGCAVVLASDSPKTWTDRSAFNPAQATAESTGVVPRLDWKFEKKYAFDLPT